MYTSKLAGISEKITLFTIEVQLKIESEYQKAIANFNSDYGFYMCIPCPTGKYTHTYIYIYQIGYQYLLRYIA